MRLGTAIKLGILIRNFQAFKEGYFYRLLSAGRLIIQRCFAHRVIFHRIFFFLFFFFIKLRIKFLDRVLLTINKYLSCYFADDGINWYKG